jgi:Cu-Zn family superoxide dismutase
MQIRFWCIAGVVVLSGLAAAQQRSKPLSVPLRTVGGGVVGVVTFRETMTGKLNINIEVKNLPEGEHAVHIHVNPVCDGGVDFRSAGGHFDPLGKQHGRLNPMRHHAGDMPENVSVAALPTGNNFRMAGVANFTVNDLSLRPGALNSVLGRSIIVHEKADDMRTDPGGNAGNRMACAVIQP